MKATYRDLIAAIEKVTSLKDPRDAEGGREILLGFESQIKSMTDRLTDYLRVVDGVKTCTNCGWTFRPYENPLVDLGDAPQRVCVDCLQVFWRKWVTANPESPYIATFLQRARTAGVDLAAPGVATP